MEKFEEYDAINNVPHELLKRWENANISIEQKPNWLRAAEKAIRNSLPRYFVFYEDSKLKGVIISNVVKHLDCMPFLPEEQRNNQLERRKK
ncbi:hypothetical protein CFI14_02110 [Lactiplantibacillus pentosus]|uniref:hypothetical protein n=1 Tax=Lactiplantibacillus pentosus TaxID=1589 RepID=UPI000EA93872|nr:hypothetical protein [Lactiplantibacillus pentosus]AYG37335.1 hypothetical protein CFK27_04965 [Lactiplantibacillus pentosus]AYG39991.1 hypothetical protein CFI14_02110 [Lactiplantibacillus pentosus]MCJ8179698.1 hypothetical protein [Lactiplantibacillus pentosus]